MKDRVKLMGGVTVPRTFSLAFGLSPDGFYPKREDVVVDESSTYLKPKLDVVELRESRINQTFNGKHEWRRYFRWRGRDPEREAMIHGLERVNGKLESTVMQEYIGSNGYESYTDILDELPQKRPEEMPQAGKLLRVHDRFPQVLRLLADRKAYEKISEEYTLQEAMLIQKRLDMEKGFRLHEMMDYGKFIIGNRSGKLYFIDSKIEAIFGEGKLTPEDFFKSEKIYDFQHLLSPHGAFTYVTLKSGVPVIRLGQTREEYRKPLEHLLNGTYRTGPNNSGHRVEHLISQIDKVVEAENPN